MSKAGRILGAVGAAVGLVAAIGFLVAGFTAKNGVLISSVHTSHAGKQGPIVLAASATGLYGQDVQVAGWIVLAITVVVTAVWLLTWRRPQLSGSVLLVGGALFLFLIPSPITLIAVVAWVVAGIMIILAARRTPPPVTDE